MITRHDYWILLKSAADPAELQTFINSVTINETYFYRESFQFECMVDCMLPETIRRKRRGDTIRIWSMPCSTGEEAYSIALFLLENWAAVDDYDVRIVGSDINTAVIDTARRGVYGTRAVRLLPESAQARYFERLGEEEFRLLPDIRESVDFTVVNIHEHVSPGAEAKFDIIFCRNMMMYFTNEGRRRVADTLSRALNPGGFVCVSSSEFMRQPFSAFSERRFRDTFFFQKPTQAGA